MATKNEVLRYPHLFEPIVLGDTYFRNRIFGSPQGHAYFYSGGRMSEQALGFYERRAQGGAASVCIGDATIDSVRSRANGEHVPMDDTSTGNRSSLNRCSDLIRRHGAVPTMEISHAGGSARLSAEAGVKIYAPVYTETEVFGKLTVAEEMPVEIIEEIIDQFAKAAANAKACGFGMVNVHGGHGWLIHQFMHPSNNRKDEWGGSFENRMRFPIAVCEAIRKAVGPKFPIEIRLSGSEVFEGGYDIDYGVAIAKALDGKVDLLHISAGSHEKMEVFTVTHPAMFWEDGVNVKYAAEIKKHVEQSKVATVGSLSDPEQMEEIIASGKADVVEIARGLMADPDLPTKAREGRPEDIRQCLRCLSCFSDHMTHLRCTCAINPENNNEIDYRSVAMPKRKERVVVAGGGIGGMQAALKANERGHEVILLEKNRYLGGVLRCEHDVPFKRHLAQYIDQQARYVTESNIDLRLGQAATPDYVLELEPDAIVAAIGALPSTPPIPGIKDPGVLNAVQAYIKPDALDDNVAILGGGLAGTELAIYLSMLGKKCTVVEMLPQLNDGGNILQGLAISIELKRYNVPVMLNTKVSSIYADKGKILVEKDDGEELELSAGSIVTAMGMRPLRDETNELAKCAKEFYPVGDCVAARNIKRANQEAYQAALDIGRI
ncbi:MAG: FAD-dependent oxidoreductase [Coriobacteriales bacterium]|jgi:2,4-dienoyl-CoA reductase-like NADH-dependent reductase (Old Yellow Enzyme family)/thioredoxin reductase